MSLKDKLNIKTTCDPKLDAADWSLYTDMENVELVAREINFTLANGVNNGLARHQTWANVNRIMVHYSAFGAADTEPREVLMSILDTIYRV